MKMLSKMGLAILAFGFVLALASPVMAQDDHGGFALFSNGGAFASAIGAGLVLMGGGAGIGRIGGSAVESMARQPDAAGAINTAMIITAAMIEGATLFGVVVCMLAQG